MHSLAVIGVFLTLLSCTGSAPPRPSQTAIPVKIPIRLELEKVIEGRLLAYDLKTPSGLALDALDNLFIADAGNHRLLKLNTEFKPIREYGGYGGGIGRFNSPEDLVLDRGLNLYVLDAGNRRVIRLDANLNYIEAIIPEDDSTEIISTLGRLSGIQISVLGEITLVDHDNSRLIRLDNFNRFSRYIGDFSYGRGALLNPLGLAMDDKELFYVADGGNGRIAVFDDYGNFLRQSGGEDLRRPSAITADPNGLIWVADDDPADILVFDSDGRRVWRMSDQTDPEISLDDVRSLTVSAKGRLYVADAGNNRVMVYRIVYQAVR
ncbi:MAG: hypothetical protein GY841_00500 [FCB group bacterium]|nr:hypothetical protein [FCB group bacterium]